MCAFWILLAIVILIAAFLLAQRIMPNHFCSILGHNIPEPHELKYNGKVFYGKCSRCNNHIQLDAGSENEEWY